MNSLKFIIGVGAFIAVFVGGLTAYFSFEENIDSLSNSFPTRSEAAVKNSGRTTPVIPSSKVKINKVTDEPSALFNDPAIKKAWGLKKSDVARAWTLTHGSRDIVVAVIDTGADINHEDLRNNIWTNPGETGLDANGKDKATNHIDDDGNGYIDDVHGWNFVSNNNDLTDNHGHGTHICGIIGAEANGKGIVGMAPEVSLMVLKYFDPKVPNTDNLKNTVAAIHYAVEKGANIINYSGGGTDFSQEEHDAVAAAEAKGILFVAAAGNERSDSDKYHYYPADYRLKNIISVTAIDQNTQVLLSSNYGVETVDIAAPGQDIESTLPGNSYGQMTGTSQATAFVSGGAALVMAHKHDFKAEDVKKYILATGDAIPGLTNKTSTSRKLNLYKALTILDKGLSPTGVTAVNMDKIQVSLDPNRQPSSGSSTDSISSFGKSLLDTLGKKQSKTKLGGKPPADQ